MFLPQYKLRTLFTVTVACALVAWVVRLAALGSVWAWCIFGTILFAGFLFAVYSVAFALAWFANAAVREPVYMSEASPFGERPAEFSLPETLPGQAPSKQAGDSPFRREG